MARKCGHCREEGHTRTTCPTMHAPAPETETAAEPAAETEPACTCGPTGDYREEGPQYPDEDCPRHGNSEILNGSKGPAPEPVECAHADGFILKDGVSRCVTCDHPDTAAAKMARYRSKFHAPDCDCEACTGPKDPMLEQLVDSGLVEAPEHVHEYDYGNADDDNWRGRTCECGKREPVSVPAPTVTDMETTPEPDPFSDPTSRTAPAAAPVPEFEFSDPTPVTPKREQTNRRGYLAKDPTTGDFRRYQNGNIKPITRVSTFVKAGSDRTALTDWNMRNVLLGAVHFPQIAAQAKILHPNPDGPLPEDKDTKAALDRIVDQVAKRVGSKRAANRGTAVHDSIERVGKGLATLDDIPADHVPWVKAYLDCLKANGLEIMPDMIEGTVFVPQFGGVMGRFDQCVRETATGKVKMADVKTGELDYAWSEIQGQLAMYVAGYSQHGTYVWDEDDPAKDEWVPPRYTLDADEGIVFHLPVKHGEPKCDPVRVDLRAGWEHVKLCARNREAASNRPKPQPYVPATVPAPEVRTVLFSDVPAPAPVSVPAQASAPLAVPPPARNWRQEFDWARSREHMASLYEQAAASGVDPAELQVLVQIGTWRLQALAQGAPVYPYATPEPPF